MLDKLTKRSDLRVMTPYRLNIENRCYIFDCLVEGYGAKKGMIVDKDSSKLMRIADELISMNYGFSCFDITEECDPDTFQEVLDDWGKSE